MGVNKQEQRLLVKYNLPISSLNYDYVGKSKNAKELEKILHVLRSGEEGTFPDLIKFCEDKLRQLCPDSKYLKPSFVEISPAEKKAVEKDLQAWVNEIKECENKLFAHSSKCPVSDSADVPVRKSLDMKHCHDATTNEVNKKRAKNVNFKENCSNSFKPQKKNAKPSSYSDWDKFNVEEELKKLDEMEYERNKSSVPGKKIGGILEPFIDNTGMTEEECKLVAEQERLKGNEAFKAQDYEEAEIYYSRSISCYPLIAALNNRALTNIKLKNFSAALCDCNTVLGLEADNVKALYRRGLAYKETSRIQLAYADFQKVLELDPGNKAAKDKIQDIEENPCGSNEKPSVKIEEISGSETALLSSHQGNDAVAVSSSQNISSSLSTELMQKDRSTKTPRPQMHKDKESKELCASNLVEVDKLTSSVSKSSDNDTELSQPPEMDDSRRLSEQSDDQQITDASCHVSDGSEKLSASSTAGKKVHSLKVETCRCAVRGAFKENSLHNAKFCDEVCELLSDQSLTIISKSMDQVESVKIPKRMKPSEISMDDCKLGNLLKTPELNSLSEMKEKVTPFKFLALWHSTGANKDACIGACLLRNVPPHQLPAVVSNKLDGDFLFQLTQAINVIARQGDVDSSFEYMLHLSKAPRIKTISSFLSQNEKDAVKDLLSQFQQIGKDVEHLNSIYLSQ